MPLSRIPVGTEPPHDINVIIENPLGGDPVKYELDKDSGVMFVDRFLHTAMRYPGNYGFVPHTLSGDGDPVDVLVVGRVPVMPGAVMRSRPVGVLVMEDEAGEDEKILAVPVDKLHPYYKDISSYKELPEIMIDQIAHFFSHYKDLEKGKWSRILRWGGPEEAGAMIMAGVARYAENAPPERAAPPPAQPDAAEAGEPAAGDKDGPARMTKWTRRLLGRGEPGTPGLEEADSALKIDESEDAETVADADDPTAALQAEAETETETEPETETETETAAAALAADPGRIEIAKGDITKLAVDAIVNAANDRLRSGGGVDGAIHRAAGPDLQKECNTLGGCPTGLCKLTKGYDLPAGHVIHCVGPVWYGGDRDEETLLASCYRSALQIAADKGFKTLAFPAISTGIYGFPPDRAATIAARSVKEFLAAEPAIERVTFICFDDETEAHYRSALPEVK